ncbi:MAG: tetratricopeptide repeat protein, partial [Bryobacteraceae bacterium]
SGAVVVWSEGGLTVTAIVVKHDPATPAYGYRFDYKGRSVVVSGDTRKWPPLADAAKELESVVKATPEEPRALTVYAMVTGRMNRWKEAEAMFRKVVQLQPQSAEAHLNLGIALADQPNVAAALEAFTVAVRLAPQSPVTHYNKGRASFDLRDYEGARVELAEACRLDTKFAPALYLLAMAEKQLDLSKESAAHLQRLLTLEPRNSEALYALGQNLAKLDDKKGALDAWRRAMEVDPQNAETLYNLSRALVTIDAELAAEYRRRFTQIQRTRQMTDRAETLGNFALSAADARDWPRAVSQSMEALEVCGDCRSKADLHKNLGLIYARSGEVENGIRELNLARDLKSSDPDIARALAILGDQRRVQ